MTVGQRLSLAVWSLGGRHADINAHSRVSIEIPRHLCGANSLKLAGYAATSQLLQCLLRERTSD